MVGSKPLVRTVIISNVAAKEEHRVYFKRHNLKSLIKIKPLIKALKGAQTDDY